MLIERPEVQLVGGDELAAVGDGEAVENGRNVRRHALIPLALLLVKLHVGGIDGDDVLVKAARAYRAQKLVLRVVRVVESLGEARQREQPSAETRVLCGFLVEGQPIGRVRLVVLDGADVPPALGQRDGEQSVDLVAATGGIVRRDENRLGGRRYGRLEGGFGGRCGRCRHGRSGRRVGCGRAGRKQEKRADECDKLSEHQQSPL